MAVVQSFPLLNLPLLPLKEVVRNMCLIDQFCFSLISKKFKELVERRHECCLKIEITALSTRVICEDQDRLPLLSIAVNQISVKLADGYLISRKLDDVDVPMKFQNKTITTLWEDKFEGTQKIITLLFRLFKVRNCYNSISAMDSKDSFRLIKHFQNLRLEFKANISKLQVWSMNLYGDIYRYVMDTFSDIPEVILNYGGINYQHNTVQPETYVEINDAGFITLRDLDFLEKYKRIKLNYLKWTNTETNQFLKQWMKKSTMKDIEFTVKLMHLGGIMDGLSVTSEQKHLSALGRRLELRDCFVVQRKDGAKANLWMYDNSYFVMQTFRH